MTEKDTPNFIIKQTAQDNHPILEVECKTCKSSTRYDLFTTPEQLVHTCQSCGKQISFNNAVNIQNVKIAIKQQIQERLNNK